MNVDAGWPWLACAVLCACGAPSMVPHDAEGPRDAPTIDARPIDGDAAEIGDAATGLTGCFTEGGAASVVGGVARIEDNATRGEVLETYATPADVQTARMTYTYYGDPAVLSYLGSGAVRRQVGLKLRSQDPCNLAYVMWRLDDQQVAVQIKRNDGQTTSAECGNNGYTAIDYTQTNVPPTQIGTTHTLSATLVGQELDVEIDGLSVWSGSLITTSTPEGAPFSGDSGWRTDNAVIDMQLPGVTSYQARCP